MIFGIMTRKEVSEIENKLIESYEAKLSNKKFNHRKLCKKSRIKRWFYKRIEIRANKYTKWESSSEKRAWE